MGMRGGCLGATTTTPRRPSRPTRPCTFLLVPSIDDNYGGGKFKKNVALLFTPKISVSLRLQHQNLRHMIHSPLI